MGKLAMTESAGELVLTVSLHGKIGADSESAGELVLIVSLQGNWC